MWRSIERLSECVEGQRAAAEYGGLNQQTYVVMLETLVVMLEKRLAMQMIEAVSKQDRIYGRAEISRSTASHHAQSEREQIVGQSRQVRHWQPLRPLQPWEACPTEAYA
jgi:hypothetical protein